MLICLSKAFSLTAPPGAEWAVDNSVPTMTKDARTAVFKRAEEIVKQAFARQPSYDDLVPALLKLGIEKLATECTMRVGVPIKPMLGNITKDLNDMAKILEGRDFACEFKYPLHSLSQPHLLHLSFAPSYSSPQTLFETNEAKIDTTAKEPKSTSPQPEKSPSSPATSSS
jgi:hypothetical protein